jgi:Mce-associated membrane protein
MSQTVRDPRPCILGHYPQNPRPRRDWRAMTDETPTPSPATPDEPAPAPSAPAPAPQPPAPAEPALPAEPTASAEPGTAEAAAPAEAATPEPAVPAPASAERATAAVSEPATATSTPAAPADIALEPGAVEPGAASTAKPDPESDEPESSGFASALANPSALPLLLLAGAAGIVLVAVAATAVFFGVKYTDQRAVDNANEQARLQVCDFARVLADYDYNNLDPYFQAVLNDATGDFKSKFAGQSSDLKNVLIQAQVKSQPAKVECGVKSGDQNTAEIVVDIDQIGSSVGTKGQPQPAQLALVATAQKVGDRWLVSNVAMSGSSLN